MRQKTYRLTITPAIIPAERHQIQDALLKLGYYVSGGGTATDMSCCDISFFTTMAKQKPVKLKKKSVKMEKKKQMPEKMPMPGKKVVIKKKK